MSQKNSILKFLTKENKNENESPKSISEFIAEKMSKQKSEREKSVNDRSSFFSGTALILLFFWSFWNDYLFLFVFFLVNRPKMSIRKCNCLFNSKIKRYGTQSHSHTIHQLYEYLIYTDRETNERKNNRTKERENKWRKSERYNTLTASIVTRCVCARTSANPYWASSRHIQHTLYMRALHSEWCALYTVARLGWFLWYENQRLLQYDTYRNDSFDWKKKYN